MVRGGQTLTVLDAYGVIGLACHYELKVLLNILLVYIQLFRLVISCKMEITSLYILSDSWCSKKWKYPWPRKIGWKVNYGVISTKLPPVNQFCIFVEKTTFYLKEIWSRMKIVLINFSNLINLFFSFHFQAKQRASIKWLLAKAYNHKTPPELREPFYKDHDVSIRFLRYPLII